MKKLFYLIFPAVFAFASCNKESINNSPQPADNSNTNPDQPVSNQGYVTVKCDRCKINYGMPDQFQGFNVAGQSPNYSYTYSPGYTLQANIYAGGEAQNITYNVFDTKGKLVYGATKNQSTDGYWTINIQLP